MAALVCAVAGLALFTFFGSATRGYVDSSSLFWWWISQWLDPLAETQHGWLILAASVWLGWRALRPSRHVEDALGAANPPDASSTPAAAVSVDERAAANRAGAHAGVHAPGVASAPGAGCQYAAAADGCESTAPAWIALAVALGLHALGFAAQQARLSIVALLVFAWAVSRLAGGRRAARAMVFPLGFLLFAIPLSLLDEVGLPLRLAVTAAGEGVAHGLGIAVLRSGTQLVAPDGRFHYDVAAPCSGVRSLVALTALSLLFGYLRFSTWRRRWVVVLSSVPLIFVGNVLRIVAIVVAAQWGGPIWGERIHAVMGYGVFIVVLGGVVAVSAGVRRFWPEPPTVGDADERRRDSAVNEERGGHRAKVDAAAARARAANPGDSAPSHFGRRGRWVATALFVVAVGAEMSWLHWLRTARPPGEAGVILAADGVNPVELPGFVGTEWIGQRTEVTAVERAVLPPDTGFSRKRYANVADRRADVFLSIVLSGRDRTSLHRPELCLVGQGWTIDGRTRASFRGPDGRAFEATVLQVRQEVATPRGRVVVPQRVAYWYIGRDEVVASPWERFLRDTWNRVVQGRADRWAYVLMQTDAAEGEAAALSRMQVILDGTLPAFQRGVPRLASK